MYFAYGENEISYLKSKDEKLAEVIEKIGMIERETDTDLFSSVIHHIIGQQISTKAQATIWQRMQGRSGRSKCGNDSGDGYFQIAVLWHDLPKSGVYHGFCRKSS